MTNSLQCQSVMNTWLAGNGKVQRVLEHGSDVVSVACRKISDHVCSMEQRGMGGGRRIRGL